MTSNKSVFLMWKVQVLLISFPTSELKLQQVAHVVLAFFVHEILGLGEGGGVPLFLLDGFSLGNHYFFAIQCNGCVQGGIGFRPTLGDNTVIPGRC
jgi:hypothetical protein